MDYSIGKKLLGFDWEEVINSICAGKYYATPLQNEVASI